MENKKDNLVIYGESGEILECSFARVDFNNPPTILTYCSDVKQEMSNLLKSSSKLVVQIEQPSIDTKDIDEISSFDASLDKSEKSKKKNVLVRGVKKIFGKVGIEAFDEVLQEDNYATRYQKYLELLEKIAKDIEHQKETTLSEANLKQDIINGLQPLIDQLEIMIEVGLKDKENYDKETESLKLNADPANIDIQNEIQIRTKYSERFDHKLIELQKALIQYKQQIQSYKLQIAADFEIVMANDSYLEDSLPILEAQGSLMVTNRIQTDKLEMMHALDAATNAAIAHNAEVLQANAQAALDLKLNGRISTQTLQQVDVHLRKGVQIFKDGAKKKLELNKKDREDLRKLSDSINEYNSEFLNFLQGSELSMNSINTSYKKRIGGK